MSNREVSRTSGVSSNDNEIVLVAGSTHQPDNEEEEPDAVYVEVTVIAKELKRIENGPIKVQQLLVSY